jgi:hypothetical protein
MEEWLKIPSLRSHPEAVVASAPSWEYLLVERRETFCQFKSVLLLNQDRQFMWF